jgi:hypothetical protein
MSASVDANGDVLFALPFEYRIYALNTKTGATRDVLEDREAGFITPATPFDPNITPRNDEEAYWLINDWQASWTPIKALIATSDHLFVQYQTFNPLRYTLDVWTLAPCRRIARLQTNSLLLDAGKDGSLYFLTNLELREQSHYEITKRRWQMEQILTPLDDLTRARPRRGIGHGTPD